METVRRKLQQIGAPKNLLLVERTFIGEGFLLYEDIFSAESVSQKFLLFDDLLVLMLPNSGDSTKFDFQKVINLISVLRVSEVDSLVQIYTNENAHFIEFELARDKLVFLETWKKIKIQHCSSPIQPLKPASKIQIPKFELQLDLGTEKKKGFIVLCQWIQLLKIF